MFNNTIEIFVNEQKKSINSTTITNVVENYTFTSFHSRNVAYKRIKMIVKNYQRNSNDKM